MSDVLFVYPIDEGIYFVMVRPPVDIKWAGVFVVSYGHIFHVIHTTKAIFPLPIDFFTFR